jgi:hypothetical protein
MFYDDDCDGPDGDLGMSAWVMSAVSPNTDYAVDLDQDGQCNFVAWTTGGGGMPTPRSPPSGPWKVMCRGEWLQLNLHFEEMSTAEVTRRPLFGVGWKTFLDRAQEEFGSPQLEGGRESTGSASPVPWNPPALLRDDLGSAANDPPTAHPLIAGDEQADGMHPAAAVGGEQAEGMHPAAAVGGEQADGMHPAAATSATPMPNSDKRLLRLLTMSLKQPLRAAPLLTKVQQVVRPCSCSCSCSCSSSAVLVLEARWRGCACCCPRRGT